MTCFIVQTGHKSVFIDAEVMQCIIYLLIWPSYAPGPGSCMASLLAVCLEPSPGSADRAAEP